MSCCTDIRSAPGVFDIRARRCSVHTANGVSLPRSLRRSPKSLDRKCRAYELMGPDCDRSGLDNIPCRRWLDRGQENDAGFPFHVEAKSAGLVGYCPPWLDLYRSSEENTLFKF